MTTGGKDMWEIQDQLCADNHQGWVHSTLKNVWKCSRQKVSMKMSKGYKFLGTFWKYSHKVLTSGYLGELGCG